MVTTNFMLTNIDSKWLKYLTLSLFTNLLIISLISINKQPILSQEMPTLKINLMALASPAPAPIKQQVKVLPQSIEYKKLITKPQAHEKVTTLKSKTIAKPVVTNPKSKAEKTSQKIAALKPAAKIKNKTQGNKEYTVIHKANYRKQIPPVYPRRALELGQEGTVILHTKVTLAGLPREVKIIKSSGYRLLDIAALAAVKKWEFRPTNINGTNITSWVRVPVRFIIQQ